MKLLKRLFAAVLLIAIFIAAGIYCYLHTLDTDYNAEVEIPDLENEVEVIFDAYAIPHIYAKNEADLFQTFGYIHAQDRLFQMEILRRLASGTLSEVFGEEALQTDKFFRTLDFKEHAKRAIAARDPQSMETKGMAAYLKGVNTYLEKGKTPIEFTLAGIPKRAFTAEDVEMIVGYMGYTFEAAFQTDAVATYILNEFGEAYLPDVLKTWPTDAYRISVDPVGQVKAAQNLAIMGEQLRGLSAELPFKPFHGSNGWVISGSKTLSGKPILSNDTHIAFSQPSVWYEAHLSCPTFEVYGSFLAGGPFPALGHNKNGGWGITMFENDDADFYREKINPKNPKQVWFKDHWEDMTIKKEVIKIKDKPDVEIDIKRTRHGYILNGAFEGISHESDPIAFQWVYHQWPSKSLEAFYQLSQSKNASDAQKAAEQLTAPGLNIMWGDTEGNIAWWAAGKLPIRPAHVNPNLILDGSSGEDEWKGYADFKYNPQVLNPEKGYLITANNQPDDMGNGLVPGYYVPSNRAKRIEELIAINKTDWTEEFLRTIINDVVSSTYPEMIDSISTAVRLGDLTSEAKELMGILKKWDGAHNLTNIEPTIFYKLLYTIEKNTLLDELGSSFFDRFEHSHTLKRNVKAFFENDSSPWWDNIATSEKETRAQIFAKSLNETSEALIAQLGNNSSEWHWSKVHTLEHVHPMGIVQGLDKFFNVNIGSIAGGRETINNMDFTMDSTGLYKVRSGPALRRIIDFNNPEVGYGVIPTGQSGYFRNAHYKDQAKMFAEGGKRHELMNREMIEKVMIGRSIFKP